MIALKNIITFLNSLINSKSRQVARNNRNRKENVNYNIDDLVTIKRAQFGTNLNLKRKYFGPFKLLKSYSTDVTKFQGTTKGRNLTSTTRSRRIF